MQIVPVMVEGSMLFLILFKCHLKIFSPENLNMHRPGIEPGPPAWQARILPLNHRCHNNFRLSIGWKSFSEFPLWLYLKYINQSKCPPRPGIEPGSPAWQAGILTTILPRIRILTAWKYTIFTLNLLLNMNFNRNFGRKWVENHFSSSLNIFRKKYWICTIHLFTTA